VKNTSTKERIMEYQGNLIQIINPIFQSPKPRYAMDYRAPFFIAEKNLLGTTISTYFFNLLVIWSLTLFFYLALYFEWLRRFVGLFSNFSLSIKK
jgi:hypothetical protein